MDNQNQTPVVAIPIEAPGPAPAGQPTPPAAEAPAPAPKKRRLWPRLLFLFLLLAILGGFFYCMFRLNVLPPLYLGALGGGLLLLFLLAALLVLARKSKFCVGLGIFLSLILAGASLFGARYAVKAISTLETITEKDRNQLLEMGVYVLPEDPAASIQDLKGAVFGTLSSLNKPEAYRVLQNIALVHQANAVTMSFETPLSLLQGLRDGYIRAIVADSHLVDALKTHGHGLGGISLRLLTLYKEAPEIPSEALLHPDPAKPFLLYISGIDSREGRVEHSLSDVNILAAVNPATRQVLLVSTPRDCYVNTLVSGDAKDKLTHAGFYGKEVSRGTLARLYNLEIPYYFRLDFNGFKAIVDALGGVDAHSYYTIQIENYTFKEGLNHLTGYQALLFARARYGVPGGDKTRGIHQMEVIKGIMKKLTPSTLAKNFFPLMDALEDSFETSLPYSLITGLVQGQLQGGSWEVLSYSVSGSDHMTVPFSLPHEAYVMIPDEETLATARQLLTDVMAGKRVAIP